MPFFSKANETKLRRNLQVCSVTVKHTPYVLVTLASMQPVSFCLWVSWLDNCIAYLWGCDPALPSASLVFTDTHTPAVISYWTDSLSPQERVQTQSAVEICSPDARLSDSYPQDRACQVSPAVKGQSISRPAEDSYSPFHYSLNI